ncbi:MAG: methionyl-tRNA formyltransferase [Bacteroidales bacterium]|nr:methionyl-tRNA formyltransferase [Bacteroidales bacterium]
MHPNGPRIVFLGTPEFAVESLKAILNDGYPVVGVITAPDKPAGRGQKIRFSPVKQFALRHDLKLLQPLKLKDPAFLEELRQLKSDLQVVVAFRMLPEEVWSMPVLGTFNLHASLLPDYRGPAPINWAIINGETRTGVTTFFINHEIDKGSVLIRKETSIGDDETAGMLHDRLMIMGAEIVVKTIDAIVKHEIEPVSQRELNGTATLKAAPKIFKCDCQINWHSVTDKVFNFIRGLSPFPGAWSEISCEERRRLQIKIFSCEKVHRSHNKLPGMTETDEKEYLLVATKDGFISIKDLQLEGKKRLEIREFLRGFKNISSYRFY